MQTTAEKVLQIAIKELGYHEKASNRDLDDKTTNSGSGNWTKYARDLWEKGHFYQGPKNGYDWCTVFVAWCVWKGCNQSTVDSYATLCYLGPYGAGCTSAVAYYVACNRFIARGIGTPKPGYQIFFGNDREHVNHTGLVEKVNDGVVYTIEGNADNMVKRRSYSENDVKIVGYGKPIYEADKPIYEADKPFPFVDVPENSWYYDAVVWAYENGIIAGTDPTHFSPNKTCTRAEVVAILYSMSKELNL